MSVFSYKGRDTHGELVRGTIEGADSGVVADQLSSNGIIPIEIVMQGVDSLVAHKGIYCGSA